MSKFRKQVEPEQRRVWDKEEYSRRVKERVAAEEKELFSNDSQHNKRSKNNFGVERDFLRPHDFNPKLNDKIGKKVEISDSTPLHQRGGWYCEVCECQLKDSHTYLDHINGKRHQRRLGRSMRIEQSSLDDVKNRLKLHKKRKYKDMINDEININTINTINIINNKINNTNKGGSKSNKNDKNDKNDNNDANNTNNTNNKDETNDTEKETNTNASNNETSETNETNQDSGNDSSDNNKGIIFDRRINIDDLDVEKRIEYLEERSKRRKKRKKSRKNRKNFAKLLKRNDNDPGMNNDKLGNNTNETKHENNRNTNENNKQTENANNTNETNDKNADASDNEIEDNDIDEERKQMIAMGIDFQFGQSSKKK